ncbi:endoribonuclease L-PSP [Verticillium alfalfae VaMs.102]|uniref:Endoribonuclease L-PSP n=1 Tax=Verticillium alfalfae (strain VaMs.102 / ATCC MYA-4576 / FGSC 10136) TaxID=526221 RepID=C9SWZ2_VERA1|nr:endoribonuclease L-PSP [Verticillium alfalfae VaMs.102]EEY23533.1 endoribonuclease L-PSP [Verticillium alfalfae VaMs.102]
MSQLKYYSYVGHGVRLREQINYNQAVRINDRIECSGQCGWDHITGEVPDEFNSQLENAFKNVDVNLRDAGGQGWSQVFKVRLYVLEFSPEKIAAYVDLTRKWMPNHSPILTGLEVAGLSNPNFKVELEVEAHDPEGAKTALA